MRDDTWDEFPDEPPEMEIDDYDINGDDDT